MLSSVLTPTHVYKYSGNALHCNWCQILKKIVHNGCWPALQKKENNQFILRYWIVDNSVTAKATWKMKGDKMTIIFHIKVVVAMVVRSVSRHSLLVFLASAINRRAIKTLIYSPSENNNRLSMQNSSLFLSPWFYPFAPPLFTFWWNAIMWHWVFSTQSSP